MKELKVKNRLKVYVLVSDSHDILYRNYFLPSLENTDLELISKRISQKGSGSCGTDGFSESMLKKIDLLISAIIDNWGEVFVFSDVDIIYLKKISKDLLHRLKRKDILFQSEDIEMTGANCGFFICRANKNSLKLWQKCRSILEEKVLLGINTNEQIIINQLLLERDLINFGLLPTDKYCSPRIVLDIRDNIIYNMPATPQNIYTYHANFLVDLKKKEIVLSKVREIINKQQGISMFKFYLNIFKKKYVSRINYHIVRFIGNMGNILKKQSPTIYSLPTSRPFP